MRFSFSLASTFIIVQEYDNIVLLYGCFDKYLFQKKAREVGCKHTKSVGIVDFVVDMLRETYFK